MSTLAVILTIGLIARLTRLVTVDQITHWARQRIVVRFGFGNLAYLVTCPWCMSVWLGSGVAVAAYWWGDTRWWLMVALAGTASLVTGWAANWLDPAPASTDEDGK
ncbi:hypothetical protein JVX90_00240 [Gordonia sp. PDNC005]|uniref:hypothetical protein n=1 Tax=Gordonia sp. PDNC005 TaxID=2811424 RepID=UPI0019667DF8|nr:hypothetical protein [Gordonia sp. PDNC005]QRY62741.1 hypothetical protein JVX90_00240 [Gordonia sp. PDNC005]